MDEIDQFEYETLPLVPLAEEADQPPADYLQRYQLATGLIIRNLTENVRYMDIAKAFGGFLYDDKKVGCFTNVLIQIVLASDHVTPNRCY